MDWQSILAVVEEFLIGASMPLIVGLISLDLALGIFEAVKKKVFEWGRVAEFYQTMVIPYVGGYLALKIAFAFLPVPLGTVLSPTLAGAALAAILMSLGASITGHIKEIGFA